MKTPLLKPLAVSLCGLAALLSCGSAALAQTPAPRIVAAIDSTSRVTLTGSRPLRALAANDIGVVPPGTQLQGMTLVFNRSAAQQSDLDALIAAQQDPASPSYHQWLTPAQFGARFGMADADLAAAEGWLRQQGFSIDGVSNSRDRIRFTGTAAQAAAAFSTELHYYRAAGETESHMAPATDISVPAALAPTLLGVTNLSGFRPHSHLVQGVRPNFTSNTTGNHFMTPGDVATIYDITAAYNAGYTGTGQTIAIVGQSAIYAADVAAFQSAAGLTAKAPTLLLEPGTGTSTVYSGDESESDLDVEYSGAIARGATVLFVYTGNGNYGAFDALQYAIDNDLAPIISSSYGTCEAVLGQSNYNLYNSALMMAAAQGETVLSAAGDAGSSDCYGEYTPVSSANAASNEQLSVDFPADSQYVTGLGGTEFPAADVVAASSPGTTTTYWAATNGSDVVSSALSYIPEQVWNDDSSTVGLASGGGGVSIYTPRPTWQSGAAPGVAAIAGTFRLVPDVSLDSSPANAPYAYCTSDTTSYASGQTHSCNSGFRDSTSGDLTVAGGTSFAAPIFAGMVAIINQAKGYTAGQGVINNTLYTLASTPATYQSAFHDITVGGNQCLAGNSYCSGAPLTDYAAGTGYDQASGLGSVDLDKLLIAWPANTTASGANFTLSASAVTTPNGTAANSTITVTPVGGYTGTVAFRITSANTVPYACYSASNATVTGTAAVTATVAITTDVATCPSGTVPFVVAGSGGAVAALTPHALPPAASAAPSRSPARWPQPLAAALTGALLLAGLSRRKLLRRKLLSNSLLRGGLTLGLLVVLGLSGVGLSGCSNSTNTPVTTTTTTTTTPSTITTAGTYTLTVTGYNPSNTAQSATTTLTLTVQ